MKPDFFKPQCQQTTQAPQFGLCDDGPGGWAYISENADADTWICEVENTPPYPVEFFAVDKCADIRRANGEQESTCDCILTYPDNIVFVELKEKREAWIAEGIAQLESTLAIFPENVLNTFRRKRAVVANRRRPQFAYGHQEQMNQFYSRHKVRLLITARIQL